MSHYNLVKILRKNKHLIKNKAFYRMCRTEYKHHPQNLMEFKRWVIKYWNDLIEAWEYLND